MFIILLNISGILENCNPFHIICQNGYSQIQDWIVKKLLKYVLSLIQATQTDIVNLL